MPEHLGHEAIYLVCQKNDFLKRPNVIIATAAAAQIEAETVPHFFRLGQKPAKVVFMNELSSSLVGYGTAHISAEDRPVHRADINPEHRRFANHP